MHEPADIFITPEWQERLQLVLHLINSTDRIPCIRGPAGVGKTAFARQLQQSIDGDSRVLWLQASTTVDIDRDVTNLLDLESGRRARTLDLVPGLVLIIDDAELLSPDQLATLQRLGAVGVRPVLIARQPPAAWSALGDMLHCVDLPPFTPAQIEEFLRHRAAAGEASGVAGAAALHAQSDGFPGRIVKLLEQQSQQVPGAARAAMPWRRSGPWLLGAGVLVVAALVFMLRTDSDPESGAPAATVTATASPETGSISKRSLSPVEPEIPKEDQGFDAWTMTPVPPDDVPYEPIRFATRPGGNPVRLPADAKPTQDPAPTPATAAPTPPPAAPPAPAVAVAAAPTTAPEQSAGNAAVPAPAAASPTGAGLGWLKGRDPAHYTLQLVATRERGAIDKFVEKHGISGEYAVFVRDLDGSPWYSLIAGSFPDRAGAVAARQQLPSPLADQAWPRTFASVLAQIEPGE